MKKNDYKLSKLKHELYQEKSKGKEHVTRKLKPDEAEYISKIFKIEIILYIVEQIKFPINFNPTSAPGIVKTVYYDYYRKHKSTAFLKLNKKQVKELERFGLIAKKYKYKIYLV